MKKIRYILTLAFISGLLFSSILDTIGSEVDAKIFTLWDAIEVAFAFVGISYLSIMATREYYKNK